MPLISPVEKEAERLALEIERTESGEVVTLAKISAAMNEIDASSSNGEGDDNVTLMGNGLSGVGDAGDEHDHSSDFEVGPADMNVTQF